MAVYGGFYCHCTTMGYTAWCSWQQISAVSRVHGYVIVWSYLMNLVLANAETIANKMFAERRGNMTKTKRR